MHGCAVLTALTAQNTVTVSAVMPVSADFVRHQLDVLLSDIHVDAIKIGMLGTADVIRAVAATLREYQPSITVLDPVLRATAGARLLDEDALAVLRDELLPLVTVVTPNADEAGALLGTPPPRSVAEARNAAGLLVKRGVRAALVTGGHLAPAGVCVDVLHDGRELHELSVPSASGTSTHGTGCTLSSAVAALLAHGQALPQACAEAQRFVAAAITRGGELEVGHGIGPVHQLGELWARVAQETG